MLISTNRPAITWSLPTGGTWLTDADALTNGRPASVSRLTWLSGAQTTASVLTLRGSWGTALVPRVLCLLGLTLPVGTLITLAFRRAADADYTYLADGPSQRVVQLPDGSRCAWFVLAAGLDPVIGVEYRLHNDVDEVATIAASSIFDIGEAWVGSSNTYCLQHTMQDKVVDPSVRRRSYGSQPFASPRLPYRALTLDFAPIKDAVISNIRTLRGTITQGASIAVVPVEDYLHDTACFGEADSLDLVALPTGKHWSATLQMSEAPGKAEL